MILNQWSSLAARIRGILQAAHLDAQYASLRQTGRDHRWKDVDEHIERLRLALSGFRDANRFTMDDAQLKAIDGLFEGLRGPGHTSESREELVWAKLCRLQLFESEMSWLLSSNASQIRSGVERALVHLQRSLRVDHQLAERWQAGFADREEACESLGAVHLLAHGIWAFKANAIGERTDLVLNEPLVDLDKVERTGSGLVLTEWKRAESPKEVDQKCYEALVQARRYSAGALASVELRAYRYLIIVSEDDYEMPPDLVDGAVTYRHVNIAISQKSPSRSARGRTSERTTA